MCQRESGHTHSHTTRTNPQTNRAANGATSLFCEYSNLAYVGMHVIYRGIRDSYAYDCATGICEYVFIT